MAFKMIFEFQGVKVEGKKVEEKVKDIWKATGKKIKDIKEMDIYFKAEEGMFYYVINEEFTGSLYINEIY